MNNFRRLLTPKDWAWLYRHRNRSLEVTVQGDLDGPELFESFDKGQTVRFHMLSKNIFWGKCFRTSLKNVLKTIKDV